MKFFTRLLSLFVVTAVFGCGGSTKHQTVAVTGRAVFTDGTLLPSGTKLLFSPNEGGMGVATAETDETGAFKVVHANGSSGAEVGKYAISLRSPAGQEESFFSTVDPKYVDGGVLVVEVKPGMGPVELKIGKAKAKNKR